MLFNTPLFLAFFIVFFAVYLLVCGSARWRLRVIVLGSLFFYGVWDYRFLPLLIFSASVDYICGRLIEKERNAGKTGKLWLVLSICSNMSLLGFFKYVDFFIDSLSAGLSAAGLSFAIPHVGVILPIGISFYTFQSMAYSVDVYRGTVPACKRPLLFLASLSFFPQLVAGPIVRAADLIPQLEAGPVINEVRWRTGMVLIALGLMKKTVADLLAPIANHYFLNAEASADWISAWTGIIAFAGQMYGDFSGYSDIAIGLGLLLGYQLPRNFHLPFLARSVPDYWNRWHISLSTWLRDYLYYPLSRKVGRFGAVMLTMLLGGLWHGASYLFLVWGLFYGFVAVITTVVQQAWRKRKLRKLKERGERLRPSKPKLYITILSIGSTFVLTLVAAVLFRSESLTHAGHVYHDMFLGSTPDVVYWPMALDAILVISGVVFCHLIDGLFVSKHRDKFLYLPVLFVVVTLCFTFTVMFSGSSDAFVYFQF